MYDCAHIQSKRGAHESHSIQKSTRDAPAFGHRKVMPRACVTDSKKHLRTFLSDALEDLGFITSECGQASELAGILDAQQPDLVVLGVSFDGIEIGKILEILVRKNFSGKVLVIGQPQSIMVKAVRQIGEEYGIAMLPSLQTPFSAGTLRASVAALLPVRTGSEPGGGRRRGAEGRLARTMVSAEDQCPHPGAQRRGGAGADAASRLGRGSAGLLHPRRQGSAFSQAVRIRDRPRHRGLALSARTAGAGRSLDQHAGFVSRRSARRCAICAARCPSIRRSAAC